MVKFRMNMYALAIGAAVAVGALGVQEVHARSVSAGAGRPYSNSDASCFSLWYGSITNNCSATKRWEMYLPIDNSGNKTATVTAYGASSSNNVGCIATGVNREITSVWSSGWSYLPSFGSAQNITLSSTYTPAGGSFYVICDTDNGGRVQVVNWNQ